VSHLDIFRSWLQNESQDLNWLLAELKSKTPSEPMLRGRAFAKVMERIGEGAEVDMLCQDGFTFCFTGDFVIENFPRREEKGEKDYGGIIVSARCDRLLGTVIHDDKTTSQFDAESYLEKYQARFYMDIFRAHKFVWNVWEVKEMDDPRSDKCYCVHTLHRLEQYRYPEMESDCRDLALRYKEFAEKWLPQ